MGLLLAFIEVYSLHYPTKREKQQRYDTIAKCYPEPTFLSVSDML